MMAYDGAATMPKAQPVIWRRFLPLKLKLFYCSMQLVRVAITCVGGFFDTLPPRHYVMTDKDFLADLSAQFMF